MAASTKPTAPCEPWQRTGTRQAVLLVSGPVGDQVLVAAQVDLGVPANNLKIRVLRWSLTFSVATDAKFTDTTPADISGTYQVGAGGNWAGEVAGGYETAAGKGLNVNNSVASRITGEIWWEVCAP